jgi:dTDP-4-amino-4,6-dideoxygalactose transaminase
VLLHANILKPWYEMIAHSQVTLDEEDIASAVKVLRSGQLAQGRVVASLEGTITSFIGVSHAAAVNSGSAALHLALLALGVGENAEVIVPSYVCTALVHAVKYVRATPVVADIDPHTYNITAETIKRVITPKTQAIIVPHMFGLPADIKAIVALGIPVVEDCAHSVGATVDGSYVGSFGAVSILSFYATKMLGAGEGGMVLTDNRELIETVRDLRDYDEKETYRVRHNYKLTDIQAALIESRFKKFSSCIDKRNEVAAYYTRQLEGTKVTLPVVPNGRRHGWYRYVIQLEDPSSFMKEMEKKGIACRRPVFKPLHRYLSVPGCPVTDKVWERAVSIPIYPSLSLDNAQRVAIEMKKIL